MPKLLSSLALGVITAMAALALVPNPAAACGGFFCNNSQPVDQAGENIVFAIEDDGTISVHVQILYQGPSEQFAWILPAPSVPELGVGTERLFTGLEAATRPSFRWDQRTEGACATEPECEYMDFDGDDRLFAAGAGEQENSQPSPPSDPEVMVHLEERVGPYDAAVVSSEDPAALVDWLRTNGYDIPEASLPLIASYAEMDMLFVALKLQKDKMSGDIVPLTMNFEAEFPMIPIRLTAIAATPDMPIRAWILGEHRVKPANFAAVDFDYNQIELWTSNAYRGLASAALDAHDGRAFITEFAGGTPAIDLGIFDVGPLAEAMDPADFLMLLQELGVNRDAGLLPVLLRVMPPPPGVEARDFYNCLARDCDTYDAYLSEVPFDARQAAEAIDQALMEPRRQADEMLGRHPQLTRLFGMMSPEQMTEDPSFRYDEEIPEVDNVHVAVNVTVCDSRYYENSAPRDIELPNGTRERMREGEIFTPYQYCERRGGVTTSVGARPPRGAGVPDYPMVPPVTLGGGGCSAASAGTGSFALLGLFSLLFVSWRKRRG